MINKKGIATSPIFYLIITLVILITVLGFFSYTFNYVTTALSGIGDIGAVNGTEAVANTLGELNTALLDKLNLLGMVIIIGLSLGMLINAFLTRAKYPRIFFIIDIILMLIAYILSTYLSNMYETIITTAPFSTFFTNYLYQPSGFLLRLPVFTIVIGALVMILSYAGIPRSKEQEFI